MKPLSQKEFGVFHELLSHSTAFNASMQEVAAYSNPYLLENSSLLFQRSFANKPVQEYSCSYSGHCFSAGEPLGSGNPAIFLAISPLPPSSPCAWSRCAEGASIFSGSCT